MEKPREVSFTFSPDERIVEGRTTTVRYRKKSYVLHVLILERTSRSGRKRRHAQIEAPIGVPIPGRGENSWDCGDDAIYGMTTGAQTATEAVKKFMADVRGTTRKRGG